MVAYLCDHIVVVKLFVTAQNQLQTSALTVIHEPVSCIIRSVSTDRRTDQVKLMAQYRMDMIDSQEHHLPKT